MSLPEWNADLIKCGNEEAFNDFYKAYSRKLYCYLFSLGRKEDLVKVAFQDTMLKVIRYAKPFDSEDELWNWLRCLAKSALYDLFAKEDRANQKANNFEIVDRNNNNQPLETLSKELVQAVNTLDPNSKLIIEQFYFQRLSQAEIAKINNSTRKAVERKIAKVRSVLRNKLKGFLKNEG